MPSRPGAHAYHLRGLEPGSKVLSACTQPVLEVRREPVRRGAASKSWAAGVLIPELGDPDKVFRSKDEKAFARVWGTKWKREMQHRKEAEQSIQDDAPAEAERGPEKPKPSVLPKKPIGLDPSCLTEMVIETWTRHPTAQADTAKSNRSSVVSSGSGPMFKATAKATMAERQLKVERDRMDAVSAKARAAFEQERYDLRLELKEAARVHAELKDVLSWHETRVQERAEQKNSALQDRDRLCEQIQQLETELAQRTQQAVEDAEEQARLEALCVLKQQELDGLEAEASALAAKREVQARVPALRAEAEALEQACASLAPRRAEDVKRPMRSGQARPAAPWLHSQARELTRGAITGQSRGDEQARVQDLVFLERSELSRARAALDEVMAAMSEERLMAQAKELSRQWADLDAILQVVDGDDRDDEKVAGHGKRLKRGQTSANMLRSGASRVLAERSMTAPKGAYGDSDDKPAGSPEPAQSPAPASPAAPRKTEDWLQEKQGARFFSVLQAMLDGFPRGPRKRRGRRRHARMGRYLEKNLRLWQKDAPRVLQAGQGALTESQDVVDFRKYVFYLARRRRYVAEMTMLRRVNLKQQIKQFVSDEHQLVAHAGVCEEEGLNALHNKQTQLDQLKGGLLGKTGSLESARLVTLHNFFSEQYRVLEQMVRGEADQAQLEQDLANRSALDDEASLEDLLWRAHELVACGRVENAARAVTISDALGDDRQTGIIGIPYMRQVGGADVEDTAVSTDPSLCKSAFEIFEGGKQFLDGQTATVTVTVIADRQVKIHAALAELDLPLVIYKALIDIDIPETQPSALDRRGRDGWGVGFRCPWLEAPSMERWRQLGAHLSKHLELEYLRGWPHLFLRLPKLGPLQGLALPPKLKLQSQLIWREHLDPAEVCDRDFCPGMELSSRKWLEPPPGWESWQEVSDYGCVSGQISEVQPGRFGSFWYIVRFRILGQRNAVQELALVVPAKKVAELCSLDLNVGRIDPNRVEVVERMPLWQYVADEVGLFDALGQHADALAATQPVQCPVRTDKVGMDFEFDPLGRVQCRFLFPEEDARVWQSSQQRRRLSPKAKAPESDCASSPRSSGDDSQSRSPTPPAEGPMADLRTSLFGREPVVGEVGGFSLLDF